MQNKKLIVAVVIVIVVILGLYFLMRGTSTEVTPTPEGTNTTGSNTNGSNTPTSNPTGVITPSPAAPALAYHPISITGYAFSPATITIKKGDTLTWTNMDHSGHSILGDNNVGPISGTLNFQDTYSYTFSTVGTFKYHCGFHSTMKGTVIVTN
ncbi:MAG: plastocyanin/azurin family copper-binding protein [Patescibacteria group bacterium]